jgi:predicted metalloprotease
METSSGETTAAGGPEEALREASEFPPAPRDSATPRFRGSQEMPFEDFVQYVIDDNNAKWQAVLAEAGVPYSPVGAVIFEGSTPASEGCGTDETGTVADSAYGPFYCPLDQTVYWPTDTVFPSGGPIQDYGDFAVAVGAAHEVGHHLQQQLGILDAEVAGEVLSIQTELQADCFAGVWGFSTFYEGLIESGDVDEALTLVQSIGDVPEQPRGGPGAHGSPEERTQAFRLGYDSGDPAQCLTFTPPPGGTTG